MHVVRSFRNKGSCSYFTHKIYCTFLRGSGRFLEVKLQEKAQAVIFVFHTGQMVILNHHHREKVGAFTVISVTCGYVLFKIF